MKPKFNNSSFILFWLLFENLHLYSMHKTMINHFTKVWKKFKLKQFMKIKYVVQWNSNTNMCTVKLVYNDHPWDPEFVAVIDRWSLFRGSFMLWKFKLGPQNCGRCRQGVVIWRWSLTQVWLYLQKILQNKIKIDKNIFFCKNIQSCKSS